MKLALPALLSGALFGLGLVVSGMTQPAKVIGFLDVFGSWDPSLAFVMIGAIAAHALTRGAILRRARPVVAEAFAHPTPGVIDADLVVGSALFGVGWGLAGLCPGPAVVSVASGGLVPVVFVGAMLAGMGLQHAFEAQRAARVGAEPAGVS